MSPPAEVTDISAKVNWARRGGRRLPTPPKGGELMLKLFSFTQALVADVADALRREEGQTMAEYGVVLAVITLAVIAAITLLSGNVSNAINSVANLLP
jgi:Flp pilus assembly pilin Flp